MFNSKVLEINLKTIDLNGGIFQDNVLLSILSNIYLSELDRFMENVMTEYNKGKEKNEIKNLEV